LFILGLRNSQGDDELNEALHLSISVAQVASDAAVPTTSAASGGIRRFSIETRNAREIIFLKKLYSK
jgi:hypothetical protein